MEQMANEFWQNKWEADRLDDDAMLGRWRDDNAGLLVFVRP